MLGDFGGDGWMETAQWDRSVTVRCGVGRFVRRVGACLRFSLCVCLSLSLRVYLVRALDVPRRGRLLPRRRLTDDLFQRTEHRDTCRMDL